MNSMKLAPRVAGTRWDRWIDADFFMQKMLEHKGYVTFNPSTGEWQSRYMDLEIVEFYFPGLRKQPGPK